MFGLGACLVLPQEGTWYDSLLTSVTEVWSGILQTALTASTSLCKPMTGPCLGKQRGAALCWTLRASTQACNASHFLHPLSVLNTTALPFTWTLAKGSGPLHSLELPKWDVWHRRLAYVHMHQDEGTSQYLAMGEEKNLVRENSAMCC